MSHDELQESVSEITEMSEYAAIVNLGASVGWGILAGTLSLVTILLIASGFDIDAGEIVVGLIFVAAFVCVFTTAAMVAACRSHSFCELRGRSAQQSTQALERWLVSPSLQCFSICPAKSQRCSGSPLWARSQALSAPIAGAGGARRSPTSEATYAPPAAQTPSTISPTDFQPEEAKGLTLCTRSLPI